MIGYLTSTQAADLLGITVNSLERWRAASRGPVFFRTGVRGRVYYRPADVEAWIEAQRVDPAAVRSA